MKLFETGKVGLFLDDFGPSTEKRKSGEVEVITLTLRCQPFTSQLASSMDQKVRGTLFMLGGNAEPRKEIEGVSFHLPLTRQIMTMFASSDTAKASIAFDQVKVLSVKARTERGIDGYACVIKASLGPVSKNELEYINGWYKTQRSVTFEQAEPDLDYEEPQPEKKAKPAGPSLPLKDEDDEETAPAKRPEPMFETDGSGQELVGAATATGPAAPDRAQRRNISHAGGKTRKR